MATKDNTEEPDFPCIVEGWMNVWEVDYHSNQTLFEDGNTPLPIWEPHFNVLQENEKRLNHFRTEKAADERPAVRSSNLKRLRLDGGKTEFDKRWGYEALECIKENVMQHSPFSTLDVFSRSQTLDNHSLSSQNSAYERESGLGERRGSVPVVPVAVNDEMDAPSTPSRIASFFSRKVIKSNLKRTKSVTKLDRKKAGLGNDVDFGGTKRPGSLKRTMSLGRLTKRWQKQRTALMDDPSPQEGDLRWGALINSRMRASRSHESLLMSPSSMHSIDLSGPAVEIKPLHSSILGQEHCFQVATSNGTKYYSCRTAEEQQKWIQHLRKTVLPDQEQSRRTENSLKLWILEAKNVAPKKKYFCEVCLDKTLYARSSTKLKGDMLFWGEQFDFNNLPAVDQITVNLYREPDKKKKKEKNALLGYVHIPVSEIGGRHLVERWYSTRSAVVGKAGRDNRSELPVIRLKAKFQTVEILPMYYYQELIQYLESSYSLLVDVLEPVLAVKAKEELATSLVHILHKLNRAEDFLTDIIMAEVNKLDNENLAFRGNSIATKAMEAYMKLVGEKYLQDTLSDLIRTVLDSSDNCEVDPMRVTGGATLQRHQNNLTMYCEMAWFKIINSHCFFPSELKSVFSNLKERCAKTGRGDISEKLISSCIFLRFLCPAILSPSLFNLTQEFPQEMGARNLTLIAKTVQSLANATVFGAKEEFMTFMNDFVEREMSSMQTFICNISAVKEGKCHSLEFDGYIDLGRELSVLHSQLQEHTVKVAEANEAKISGLCRILSQISETLDNPETTTAPPVASTPARIYDNVVSMKSISSSVHSVDGVTSQTATSTTTTAKSDSKEYTEWSLSRSGPVNPARLQPGVTQTHVPSQPLVQELSEDHFLVSSFESCAANSGYGPTQSTPLHSQAEVERVNHSWNKMVSAANVINGEFVDLISFMDDIHEDVQNSSVEIDSGDQMSVGQVSTIASSGYQSYGYSQSNSPVESLGHDLSPNPVPRQPLEFSNPLYGHQAHDGVKMCRTSSASSLSSDEGARRNQKPAPPSQTSTKSIVLANNAAPSKTSKFVLSCNSSSAESLSQLDKQKNNTNTVPMVSRSVYHLTSPSDQRLPMSPLVSSDLSKSAEIPPYNQDSYPYANGAMKRTVTDSVLVQNLSPTSPEKQFTSIAYGPKRSPPQPQPMVRMGVSSVQRKLQEQEKAKQEYEHELTLLRQRLGETQTMLQETQDRLQREAAARENLECNYKNRLEETEEKLKSQKQEKDAQMKNIIGRLLNVEEELHREQSELQTVVTEKQKVIDVQERRIQSLDAANNRLLAALAQLKEKCQVQNRNGMASPARSRSKLSLHENGEEFKSSSC